MYYHGFDKKFPSGNKAWTVYDDQLIGMLFSRIINKTVLGDPHDQPELLDHMVNNLFDVCFYISKDVKEC